MLTQLVSPRADKPRILGGQRAIPRFLLRERGSEWLAVPSVLLLVSLLAFGISIPWLGLYADDWPFAYVNHLAGLRGVVDFISWVRPVAAWVFGGASALVGTQFWLAHGLLLLLRWFDSILFWLLLRQSLPEKPNFALWAALLFAVFPAFKQQPLALEYFPHFVALALLFGSMMASLRLANGPRLARRTEMFLGWLAWAGAFQVFIIEYFAGLEALRPALLFVSLARCMDWKLAAKETLRRWLPFLPVMAAFVAWRVLVVGFPSYQPELVTSMSSGALGTVMRLVNTISHDLWTAGILTWVQPFMAIPVGGRTLLAWGGLVGVTGLGVFAFLWQTHRSGLNPGGLRPAWIWVALGLLAMLAAGWPFWITRIPLDLNFPWDRTSLAFLVGACLLGAGLLGLLAALPGKLATAAPNLMLAAVVGFSVGLHFQNANLYRKEWSILTPFYWQLTWRVPGLQPGTAIVLDQPPFNYHVDKFLSPLVNWTYAPDSRALQTPYALLDFHKLWGKSLPPKTGADIIRTQYGTLVFAGDTAHLLVVVYSPPGCLRVLTQNEAKHLVISQELKESLPLTNLSMIDPAPDVAARPPDFLGPEPEHGWCYTFEKIELANQMGDWAGGAALADEALAQGLSASQPSENLALVTAYAHMGRWEDARKFSEQTAAAGDFYRTAACSAWEQIGRDMDAEQAAQMRTAIGCP